MICEGSNCPCLIPGYEEMPVGTPLPADVQRAIKQLIRDVRAEQAKQITAQDDASRAVTAAQSQVFDATREQATP